jgi:uncharacterized protein YndB with AHSA1/START domain
MSHLDKLVAVPLLMSGLAGTAAASANPVTDTSYVSAGGERVLEQSIVIDASVGKVWDAFTTTAGFRSWAAPVAEVDFRLGGIIEASYDTNGRIGAPGNIKNEIVAYVPHRMLAIRNVRAPPNTPFDAATFQKVHTVNLFEPLTPTRTRVTVVQPGFGSGAAYEVVYKFFSAGNRWSLEQLKNSLETAAAEN